MRWGKACLSIDPKRGGAPVTGEVVFQKEKVTCLPGYNLSPVPEAWNRSCFRRRGVIILSSCVPWSMAKIGRLPGFFSDYGTHRPHSYIFLIFIYLFFSAMALIGPPFFFFNFFFFFFSAMALIGHTRISFIFFLIY